MFELLDHLTGLLASTLGSPWLWVIVFFVAGLDALLPFMPSETTVITVAVLIGSDPKQLALLVFLAGAGALAGDCLSFLIGRKAGPPVIARVQRGPKGVERYEWARGLVQRHATVLIVAARYLPGGRVASALATGSTGFPAGRFVALDAIGAFIWAGYSTLIGWLGGAAFSDRPVFGLLLAFAIGLVMVSLIEAGRRFVQKRGKAPGHSAELDPSVAGSSKT
jgi:membrane protein DedA with SNARE-associated domain